MSIQQTAFKIITVDEWNEFQKNKEFFKPWIE